MEVYSKDDFKHLSGCEISESSEGFESSDSDDLQMATSDEESDSEGGGEMIVKKKSSGAIQMEEPDDAEDVFLTKISAELDRPTWEGLATHLEANIMEISPHRFQQLAHQDCFFLAIVISIVLWCRSQTSDSSGGVIFQESTSAVIANIPLPVVEVR